MSSVAATIDNATLVLDLRRSALVVGRNVLRVVASQVKKNLNVKHCISAMGELAFMNIYKIIFVYECVLLSL